MLTSEHLLQLRRDALPRLPFVAALIGSFVVALWVCVKLLAVWTHEINHRRQAVDALGPSTRALTVGSSHVFSSIHPELLSIPSMNLAAAVCSYVCVEGIVLGNLGKVPALQALVIELDVVPVFYDTLQAYRGDNRQLLDLEPAVLDMDLGAGDKYALWRDQLIERSFFAPLFRPGKITPKGMSGRIRDGRRTDDEVVAPGYANGHELMPAEDDGPARARRHVAEAAGLAELPRNERALRRVLELGLSRNLKLALVRLPHHPGYWEALPLEWQREMSELRVRLERDFPSVEYWDYGQLPGLDGSDYRNGDHLNDQAARRFTVLFDARLSKWIGETPLTGTPP
ncbi:MAG: hypothetical protein RL685_895 [Pseudomonadota bacterium]|jgi:hypothetical protein